AAERNGFPGPKHVLELKEKLGLTPDQIRQKQDLRRTVKRAAVTAGGNIVKAEEDLFQSFENGSVTEKSLQTRLHEIARMRGELRLLHLQAPGKIQRNIT